MPTVSIPCPECGKILNVPQERMGTQANCPACKNRILLTPPVALTPLVAVAIPVDDFAVRIEPVAPVVNVAAAPNAGAAPSFSVRRAAPVEQVIVRKPATWAPPVVLGAASLALIIGVVYCILVGSPNPIIVYGLWAGVGYGVFKAKARLNAWPTSLPKKTKLGAKHFLFVGGMILSAFTYVMYAKLNMYRNPQLLASIPEVMAGLAVVAVIGTFYRSFMKLSYRFGGLSAAAILYSGGTGFLALLFLGFLTTPDPAAQAAAKEKEKAELRAEIDKRPHMVVAAPTVSNEDVVRNLNGGRDPNRPIQPYDPTQVAVGSNSPYVPNSRTPNPNPQTPANRSQQVRPSSRPSMGARPSSRGSFDSSAMNTPIDPIRPPTNILPIDPATGKRLELPPQEAATDLSWKFFKKKHGENSVARIIVSGVPSGIKLRRELYAKIQEGTTAHFRSTQSDGTIHYGVAGVDDLAKYGGSFDFWKVVSIDAAERTITVEADAVKMKTLAD